MRLLILFASIVFVFSIGRAERADERAKAKGLPEKPFAIKSDEQWACEESLNDNVIRGTWPRFYRDIKTSDAGEDVIYILKFLEEKVEPHAKYQAQRKASRKIGLPPVPTFPEALTKAVCTCLSYEKVKTAAEAVKSKMENYLKSIGEEPSIGCSEIPIS